ncbi:MAG: hypothetical protein ACYDBP_12415 [Leptospirales bacterium]
MKKFAFCIALAATLAGCATVGEDYGIPHTIKTSGGARPAWIDNPHEHRSDHKNRLYFVGVSSGTDDYALARADAKANALAQVADQIRNTVHSYFNSARTLDSTHPGDYSTETERAIESGTLSVSQAVVTGDRVDRYWWKEYWIRPFPGGEKSFRRDVYVLVSLKRNDYVTTVENTLEGLRKQIRDSRARQVLKFMKEHYLNDTRGMK